VKRLLPLAAIELLVWGLLLLVMLLISRVAFEINIGAGSLFDRIATQVVRVFVSAIIVLVWLFAWKKITDTYFWRTMIHRKTTSQRSSE
jgi:hypothetical protein